VAGAGTGSTPWAHRTVPEPTLAAEQAKPSNSSWSRARQMPTMSTMESTAPTSWKWTVSGGRPWIFPSATARCSKIAVARARTAGTRGAAAIISRIWANVR